MWIKEPIMSGNTDTGLSLFKKDKNNDERGKLMLHINDMVE